MNIEEVLKNNNNLFNEYPIFEIEYNQDGTKKSFYELASERDIKETQIKSDENELDFLFSQNKITKEDYDKSKEELEFKLEKQNTVYNDLIFSLISEEELNDLKKEIEKANLNDIDLKRLASSLGSIAEEKIADFQNNNKQFKEENLKEWNARYDSIARSYGKTRELESFILSLIE
ncbi:MAG: hypothetical protein IKF36_02570 [Bacilli bacterium]|nr:hypothetical protein [Bacilli bacterium]